jgi:hypothetical protein
MSEEVKGGSPLEEMRVIGKVIWLFLPLPLKGNAVLLL